MDIELTNGKKIIKRRKEQYEANINHYTMRGFKPVQKEIKKTTDKVVELKPKRKHAKKTKKKN